MNDITKPPPDAARVEHLVRQHYCVWDREGREDPVRVHACREAIVRTAGASQPVVPGVPALRMRVDRVEQIAEAVRRFLPEVERDARLHARSFIDPLAVANELGIAVSPLVARV